MSHPQYLLENIYWTNRTTRYPDREKFEKEVRTYQHDIAKTDKGWRPDELALAHPRALIQFRCWIGEEDQEPNFLIEADNGESFTVLELFHKVCDGIGQTLMAQRGELYDHRFFEGLSLYQQRQDPPLYFVNFGS
jgi:hypothetical protein